MNEEKNLQNDEEKLREVNPESITTDETNNTEKETRYGYSLFTIFSISFITAILVNFLLSFALVPTVIDKIEEDLIKTSAKSIIEETSNDKDSEASKKRR